MPSDLEIGELSSTHEPRVESVAAQIVLVLFCLAVAIGMGVVAIRQYETIEILKRVGLGALFLVAAGMLAWNAWGNMHTRVEIGEWGIRYKRLGPPVAVRWEDFRQIEQIRVNGKLTIVLYGRAGERLVLNRSLSAFDAIVEALRARGILRR